MQNIWSTLARNITRTCTSRIYAIGDIHGRFDLLKKLLSKIETFDKSLPPNKCKRLIFLGDLIDRGPQSIAVLRFVWNLQKNSNRIVVLMGNHERLLLNALNENSRSVRSWLQYGGNATLQELGINFYAGEHSTRTVIQNLRDELTDDLIEWVEKLPLTVRYGNYLFCHAGIRPGIPLKSQSPDDILWIRRQFLNDKRDHGMIVVHGHTISNKVDFKFNRIGVDTGAFSTGVLSAVCLEGSMREAISSSEHEQ